MSAPYNLAADDAAVLPHILSALEAKPAGPGRYSFRCPLPNHGRGNGDRNPSASIGLAEDGGIAVNCFGGCNPKELWAAAVLPHLPRRPDTAAAEHHLIAEPQLIAVYPAPRDDSGRPAVKVYRKPCAGPDCDYPGCKGKAGKNGKAGKHIWQNPTGHRRDGYPVLLWGDDDGEKPVVVVEGEKAAAAIAAAGRLAASYIGGHNMAGKADYSALSGRPVLHWPDFDTPGIKAAHAAAAAIDAAGIAYSQTILPAVGKKGSGWDAADLPEGEICRHIDAGGTLYIPGGNAYIPAPAGPQTDNPGLLIGGYYDIGKWYADRLLGKFRYDPETCAWYRYDGGVWIELNSRQVFPELLAPFISRRFALANELIEAKGIRFEAAGKRIIQSGDAAGWINHDGGVLGGIRETLTAALPIPPLYYLGTPDGVVDLRNGQLLPHSPDFGLRCLTAGRYRPEDYDYLFDRLATDRYGIPDNPILTAANLDTLIRQIGLTLTGQSVHLTALTLIVGLSGSSKTNTVSLVKAALGGYAMAAPENLLEPCRSDIDFGLADIIDFRPRMLAHDEIAADSTISIKKLLGLTGYKELTARRPHGTPRHGKSIAALWTTAVNIPKWPAGQGMRRRLSIIETARQLADREKTFAFDPDFLDAVVTLGCKAAAAVYQDGYAPPYGDETARQNVLADMDSLADWILHLPADWHGRETNEARKEFIAETDGVEVSTQEFAATVKASGRWKIRTVNRNGRKNVKVLDLIDNPLL